MEKVYKTAIIGGGAAGLFAASILADNGAKDTLLIERNPRLGKKLSATGNGQGNITNAVISENDYHGEKNAAYNLIQKYPSGDLLAHLSAAGGVFLTSGNGRVYPAGLQAASVTDLLRLKTEPFVCVKTQTLAVSAVQKNALFEITCLGGAKFLSKNLVLACGGKAAKHFGSDGAGYELAKGFGHKITPLYPSLVQLKTQTDIIRGLKGIKVPCVATAITGGLIAAKREGEVLFNDYGLSGNAAFELSPYFAGVSGGVISLCFIPSELQQAALNAMQIKTGMDIPAEELFTGIINKQLGRAVLRAAGYDAAAPAAGLKDSLRRILALACSFDLKVTGDTGFDNAQVTRGGVDFAQIDKETLMSKKVNGLYFCGELLNADGDCGGYNIQWAYSSAAAVCTHILKNA